MKFSLNDFHCRKTVKWGINTVYDWKCFHSWSIPPLTEFVVFNTMSLFSIFSNLGLMHHTPCLHRLLPMLWEEEEEGVRLKQQNGGRFLHKIILCLWNKPLSSIWNSSFPNITDCINFLPFLAIFILWPTYSERRL